MGNLDTCGLPTAPFMSQPDRFKELSTDSSTSSTQLISLILRNTENIQTKNHAKTVYGPYTWIRFDFLASDIRANRNWFVFWGAVLSPKIWICSRRIDLDKGKSYSIEPRADPLLKKLSSQSKSVTCSRMPSSLAPKSCRLVRSHRIYHRTGPDGSGYQNTLQSQRISRCVKHA